MVQPFFRFMLINGNFVIHFELLGDLGYFMELRKRPSLREAEVALGWVLYGVSSADELKPHSTAERMGAAPRATDGQALRTQALPAERPLSAGTRPPPSSATVTAVQSLKQYIPSLRCVQRQMGQRKTETLNIRDLGSLQRVWL